MNQSFHYPFCCFRFSSVGFGLAFILKYPFLKDSENLTMLSLPPVFQHVNLRCPRKHFWQCEVGLRKSESSFALRFGTAWHAAMEAIGKR